MKKLLFIAFIFPMVSSFAQSDSNQDCLDEQRYLYAFNYIKADSVNLNKTIYVIDSIADLDIQWFREDLNKLRGEKKTIQDYFKFEWEENRHSPLLASLFNNKNNLSNKILIFSDVRDNMIIANLWDRKFTPNGQIDTNNSISWVGRLTEGYSYLFVFDDNNNIITAFRISLISD